MTNMKITTALGAAALSLSLAGCESASTPVSPTSVSGPSLAVTAGASATSATSESPAAAKPGALTIVGLVLQDDDEFDVLQAAVIRAGLAEALNGKTQYTVFAPTDAAFVTTLGAADEAAAIATVNDLPIETLSEILRFHVTHGRRNSQSVLAAPSYQMLNGATLTRTQLTAAGLAATDISASNGIVHVINAVLLPQR